MIMVIHSNNDITSNANTHSRQKAGSAHLSNNKAEHSPASDKSTVNHAVKDVQLSQEAQTIKRLETKIQSSEGVDTAKVDHIKQQIADGSYEINSQRIADQLLTHDALLG